MMASSLFKVVWRRLSSLLPPLLALLLGRAAVAQDSHHWTDQIGNRARLLGGAVIGSADDLSALFYNPGSLALVENPELLLAGSVLQLTSVRLENVEAPERGVGQLTAQLSPSLFAGEIGGGEPSRNRVAYSFLTKVSTKFRLSDRSSTTTPDFSARELDLAGIDSRLELDLTEYWFGGTYARKLGESSGIGVSTFLAVRNQSRRRQVFSQALTDEGQALVSLQSRDFSYQHWRLLWKFGYSTVLEKWKVGLSVTTPGVGLGGSGSTGIDRTLVGQAVDDEGHPTTEIASNFQKTSAEFRSPLSVGGGAARTFGKARVHVSAEWFDRVSPYELLDTEPFEGQTSGETIATDVIYGLESVLNAGVGVEYAFRDDLGVYASFRTDRSGFDESLDTNASTTTYDIFHVAGGASFGVGGQDFTLGGVVAFGNSVLEPDITDGAARNPMLDVRYTRVTIILGVNFSFGP